MKNIFIIGSKGIPSNYGGFETFVEMLTKKRVAEDIKYHVACLSNEDTEFEYNNSRCFNVKVPDIGAAKAVLYDLKALRRVYKYIKENKISDAKVYILACRIGPFMRYYRKLFDALGVPIYVNPDGHEWKREKWNYLIKKYWKISEKLMIKNADIVICDSLGIEEYIKEEYKRYNPKTEFIAYGATVYHQLSTDDRGYLDWLNNWKLKKGEYYLIVGRFVPENNYELMINEFMKSDTKKSLVIVTNVEKNKFYNNLKMTTNFTTDNRIKFVGTIYDQDLLSKVRTNAYAYIHGHEMGGTNPSLLEALATTPLNLLLDVNFNREVAEGSAFYFDKREKLLSGVISVIDKMSQDTIEIKALEAKERINNNYTWELIVNKYEKTFLKDK